MLAPTKYFLPKCHPKFLRRTTETCSEQHQVLQNQPQCLYNKKKQDYNKTDFGAMRVSGLVSCTCRRINVLVFARVHVCVRVVWCVCVCVCSVRACPCRHFGHLHAITLYVHKGVEVLMKTDLQDREATAGVFHSNHSAFQSQEQKSFVCNPYDENAM